jgi:predicted ATP-grasp superfamily ATP-dependent carboligase
MNVLVTSSRMPFALDEIRKFGRAGHQVFAADTFFAAPGSHSRYVARHFELTPPAVDPLRYVADVDELVRRYAIDLIVPCFEEAFYLSRHRAELPWWSHLFAADFALLKRLHHKASFHFLAEELGIPTPATTIVSSSEELAAALARTPRFVARPAWSRGGIDVCTNAGPLANALAPRDCAPTVPRPWIVQEYVEGPEICSFGVAQRGRLMAQCTYVHPKEIEHAGGIVFESVRDDEVLACVQRVVQRTGYHGQISLDFKRGRAGLMVLECNPRPTAGVHLMEEQLLVDAILGRLSDVAVVPPGARRLYASALVRDALLHPRELPADMLYLFSDADDIYAERGDWLPALFQVLSYGRVLAYRRRHREASRRATKLMSAYFDGISWNGQPI